MGLHWVIPVACVLYTAYLQELYAIRCVTSAVLVCGLALMVCGVPAMDGGNGGWAALYGASLLGASYIDLVVHEDQANDAERSHTTEQVGYIVFAD